jgi:hypothetical protein
MPQRQHSRRCDLLNTKRSGELYWVTLYITPIRDESGVIQRFISVQSDSTVLHKMQSDLEYKKARAEAANHAKSAFLATMSHEIRTPMNSILGMAQTLMEPLLETGQRQACARILMESGETLLSLLNDILDLSRIEVSITQRARGEQGDDLEFAVTDTGVGVALAELSSGRRWTATAAVLPSATHLELRLSARCSPTGWVRVQLLWVGLRRSTLRIHRQKTGVKDSMPVSRRSPWSRFDPKRTLAPFKSSRLTCPEFVVPGIIRVRSNRSKCGRTEKNAVVLRESDPLVDTHRAGHRARAHCIYLYEWRLAS